MRKLTKTSKKNFKLLTRKKLLMNFFERKILNDRTGEKIYLKVFLRI